MRVLLVSVGQWGTGMGTLSELLLGEHLLGEKTLDVEISTQISMCMCVCVSGAMTFDF